MAMGGLIGLQLRIALVPQHLALGLGPDKANGRQLLQLGCTPGLSPRTYGADPRGQFLLGRVLLRHQAVVMSCRYSHNSRNRSYHLRWRFDLELKCMREK
jgi:hypothetical protein